KKHALDWLAREVATRILGAPLTLPAERDASMITYEALRARDSERGRKRRPSRESRAAGDRERAPSQEQGDIRYPAPAEEFLDFLTDVELAASPLNAPDSPFGRLASRIEERIQAGHRTGYEATALGGRELALEVSDTLRIDLYDASSPIKQLAPLLLYLRYRAAARQMLIIDEPELNLHPEGQAELLEALAMLSNLGVTVLLTTHSPYIMAHLNTLVAADTGARPRRLRQAEHLFMGDPAAFLARDAVSAYEMRTDGLVALADPAYGIRCDTLSDVSAELQRRYFAVVKEPKRRAKRKT
ncbi:MAG TPA: ATP-binding protein, partial [Nannocystis sp.]